MKPQALRTIRQLGPEARLCKVVLFRSTIAFGIEFVASEARVDAHSSQSTDFSGVLMIAWLWECVERR